MNKIAHYQVNTSFLGAPYVYVNLYDDTNTQVGRIEIDDLAMLPLLEFTLELLRTGKTAGWHESAKTLGFGTVEVGQG